MKFYKFSYQTQIILKPGSSPACIKTSWTGLGPDAPALSLQHCPLSCLITSRVADRRYIGPRIGTGPATVAALCAGTCFDWFHLYMSEFMSSFSSQFPPKAFWWLCFPVSRCGDKPHKPARFVLTGLFCASCGPVPFLWCSLPISSLRCSHFIFLHTEGLSSLKCRICVTKLTNLRLNHRMMEIRLQKHYLLGVHITENAHSALFLFN